MQETVLLTGAGGKTGLAVTRACKAKGLRVRAMIHRPELAGALQAAGAVQTVVADLLDPDAVAEAARGAAAVYHIPPNVHPSELQIGKHVIEAAVAVDARLIFHSVLHPQTESMPHHWQKLRVEEHLFESGLDFTILQPAAYMQNVLADLRAIRLSGEFRVPYPVDTKLSLVDLEDVAACAATVLSEAAHRHAIYELAGPEPITPTDCARFFSRSLDIPIKAVEMDVDAWARQARADGLGEYQVTTLMSMFRYYAQFGFLGNSRVLEMLLDRAPTRLEVVLERMVERSK